MYSCGIFVVKVNHYDRCVEETIRFRKMFGGTLGNVAGARNHRSKRPLCVKMIIWRNLMYVNGTFCTSILNMFWVIEDNLLKILPQSIAFWEFSKRGFSALCGQFWVKKLYRPRAQYNLHTPGDFMLPHFLDSPYTLCCRILVVSHPETVFVRPSWFSKWPPRFRVMHVSRLCQHVQAWF